MGRPLMELFSVLINHIDGENPGDLYGTVIVTDDGPTSQDIYNRTRENYESIKPNETALLIGPTRSISAAESFTIDVDLMDKDSDLSPDDEISKGQIHWNANTNNVYDTPLYTDVRGEYGSVTVSYIVFSDAVEATVEVTLINGDGENPANVYGMLTARNGTFTNESVLFRQKSNENVSVRPWALIPLSRSVIAIPSNSSLIIAADLLDYDVVSSDDQIAKGSVEFPAQLSGSSEKHITGQYGEIKVKVTWN